MKATHPWVDPEQIRKLAERLMAPYPGLEGGLESVEFKRELAVQPVHEVETVEVMEIQLAENVAGGEDTESVGSDEFEGENGLAAWIEQETDPVGQTHPLRERIGMLLPGAAARLRGPGGEVEFDDGNLAHLGFLVEQLVQAEAALVWLKWFVQAGETVHAGVFRTPLGNGVLVIRCPGTGASAEVLEELRVACVRNFSAV